MLFAFAACANEPAEPDTSATDAEQEEEVRTVGVLFCANITEEELAAIKQKAGRNDKIIFYNDLNTMLLALQAGEIDEIGGLPEDTVDYIVARNADMIKAAPGEDLFISFMMAVKQENAQLQASLNDAIKTLKDNGTLEQLIADYITAYATGTDDPEAVEIPVIEGADTVRIAITGDVPPMDLVTADGKAAGFNVALLAELSKLMNVNFELVSMDTAARTLSLASDKVDAIFWTLEYSADPGADLPDTLAATEPYYTDAISEVKLAE